MIVTFELLSLASLLGAVDVLYFHVYRFRLYRQPGSGKEQFTHLVRAAIFLAVVAIVAFSSGSPIARYVLLALAALDVVNNIADVSFEKRSRAPLGGLPTGEYVLHIVGTFLIGLATASIVFESSAEGFTPLPDEPFFRWRAAAMVAGGIALLGIETGLWVRAMTSRARAPLPQGG